MGFECQKAVVDFRGRTYEAWFAPKIPIGAGPWKFFGLPGLILEVRDQKREVFFMARTITVPYEYEVERIENFIYEGIEMEWLDYQIKRWKKRNKFGDYLVSKMYEPGGEEDDFETEITIKQTEIISQEVMDNYEKDH